jgi:hypothetical protein
MVQLKLGEIAVAELQEFELIVKSPAAIETPEMVSGALPAFWTRRTSMIGVADPTSDWPKETVAEVESFGATP